MDNITKYLHKIAYKFPKGYPDVNNPEEKAMLLEMVEEFISEDEEVTPESEKAEVIELIKQGKFSLEQLKALKSSIAGIEYKDDFFAYTNSKQMNKRAATAIYNKAIELNIKNSSILPTPTTFSPAPMVKLYNQLIKSSPNDFQLLIPFTFPDLGSRVKLGLSDLI